MGVRQPEQCAYCGRPLRLVAGFCAECLAPESVARRRNLVADSRRRAGIAMTAHSAMARAIAPTVEASAAALAARPHPRWPASAALLGVVVLLIALGSIGVHVANGMGIAHPPMIATMSLSIRLGDAGPETRAAAVGQMLVITYSVAASTQPIDVALTIVPGAGLPATMRERWPAVAMTRTLRLVPALPGIWHIMLARDGQIAQIADIVVRPA